MNKLILVAALAVSFPAVAAFTHTMSSNTVVYTAVTENKAEAFETGIAALQELKQLTGQRVYQKLNVFDDQMIIRTLKVDRGRVFVDEFADVNGKIKYQAKLKLIYSYQEVISDD